MASVSYGRGESEMTTQFWPQDFYNGFVFCMNEVDERCAASGQAVPP